MRIDPRAGDKSRAEVELNALRKRFETWRQKAVRPRRIPEDLWSQAIALTALLATSRVTKALRLGYVDVRRRQESSRLPVTADGLVEVRLDRGQAVERRVGVGPLAEIARPDGAVLRLYSPAREIITAFMTA